MRTATWYRVDGGFAIEEREVVRSSAGFVTFILGGLEMRERRRSNSAAWFTTKVGAVTYARDPMTDPTLQGRCDAAREHLRAARTELMTAYAEMAERGLDPELAKTLNTAANLADMVLRLCVTLPLLQDVSR